MNEEGRDRRLLRGAESRRTIVRRAVDVASLDGLDGLSFGRLASDLRVSKSGIQTLFGTKENLQVATVEAAGAAFATAVIEPALPLAPGIDRLRALLEGWIGYAEQPLFPGGCFWAANLPTFDSAPGPVRESLLQHQRAWRALIAAEAHHAVDAGEIADLDPDLVAFQLDAVLTATNIALRCGDSDAVARMRRIIDATLGRVP